MNRAAKQKFRCEPLAQLDRQLRFAPAEKRAAQLRRAEKLHDEIDAAINYPFDYLAYRITRYRRDGDDSLLLVGEAVLSDLREMIDTLSRSVAIGLDDEPTETVEQLAARLQVSTKTIHRWRQVGLRWRWTVTGDGSKRRRVGITRKAMQAFAAAHRERVEQASGFTRMSAEQRAALIERARVLAGDGRASLNQVARKLAEETGRALETLRLLLEKHDRGHPEQAIFTNHHGPLTQRERRVIARAHRMGVSVKRLCGHFGRTRSTVYRAINERRALEASQVELSWIGLRTFTREDADEVFLRNDADEAGGVNGGEGGARAKVSVAGLPGSLARLYRVAVIAPERQRSLFLRYNYLKFRAARLREGFDRYEVRAGDLDAFEALLGRARRIRSVLVRTNLPTVLSVARRHLVGKAGHGKQQLFELLEVGYEQLVEAIEVYDAARNQRFTAVLTNRLLRRFAREGVDETGTRRAQRRVGDEEALERMVSWARRMGVDLGMEEAGSRR